MSNSIRSTIGVMTLFALFLSGPATAGVAVNDSFLLNIPPIVAGSLRKGVPESSGRGIQQAAGPFYSSQGKLGGVYFNRIGVNISLKGGNTPMIAYQVDGDTTFNLEIDKPLVPVQKPPYDLDRLLTGDHQAITFTGYGSRPITGLTVPSGVICMENTMIKLKLIPTPSPSRVSFAEAYAIAENLTAVTCRNGNGSVWDEIEGIKTKSTVEELVASF